MADEKKTAPAPNPAKAVKAPQLPTKSVRDSGGRMEFHPPKRGEN